MSNTIPDYDCDSERAASRALQEVLTAKTGHVLGMHYIPARKLVALSYKGYEVGNMYMSYPLSEAHKNGWLDGMVEDWMPQIVVAIQEIEMAIAQKGDE